MAAKTDNLCSQRK